MLLYSEVSVFCSKVLSLCDYFGDDVVRFLIDGVSNFNFEVISCYIEIGFLENFLVFDFLGNERDD